MSWLSSIAVGAICGLFGVYVVGIVASYVASWYGVSSMELIFDAVGGGVFSAAVGVIVARAWTIWGSRPNVVKAAGVGSMLVALIGAGTALTLWILADIPPEIQRHQIDLEVEFRMPPTDTTPPAEIADPVFTLSSTVDRVPRKKLKGVLRNADARLEDGRWIIPATVFLFTTRGQRLVEAQLGGEIIGAFVIPLPPSPGREYEQWSEWSPKLPGTAPIRPGSTPLVPAKAADKGKTPPPPPVPPPLKGALTPASKGANTIAKVVPIDNSPGYRFRIVPRGGDPRPMTEEEIARDISNNEKARFLAIKPDAPIAEWFPYTRYGAVDEWRSTAIGHIVAKPNYTEELSTLMLSDNNQIAAEAMYLTRRIAQPPEQLLAGIAAAGRDIANRLEKFNTKVGDADTTFIAAADLSIRFAAWIDAARSLRRSSSGDFVPDLVAILNQSRLRTENEAIQQEIRRVASHFAKEWAGIEPLKGDPPW